LGTSIQIATPRFEGNERKYLNECIDTGWVTYGGRFEAAFELAFAEKFGRLCVATSSGTAALHLALLSLGVRHGDEVIVPDLTFGATASVVMAVGATPVFVDVSHETWGLDKDQVRARVTWKTRAIIPVHLYGEDAGDFSDLGVPVVEDACESLGFVPQRGRMTCYSFYGNKVMTTGEGGMICGEFGNAREWRNGGFDKDYWCRFPGLNYRMTNMQAAVGLAQLERFDELIGIRKRNLEIYNSRLKGKGKWLFVAQVDNPARTAIMLKSHGVASRPVFPPLHRSPAFRSYATGGSFPVSESIYEHGIALPTDATVEQTNFICDLLQ
jgi:perosamine synthetase